MISLRSWPAQKPGPLAAITTARIVAAGPIDRLEQGIEQCARQGIALIGAVQREPQHACAVEISSSIGEGWTDAAADEEVIRSPRSRL